MTGCPRSRTGPRSGLGRQEPVLHVELVVVGREVRAVLGPVVLGVEGLDDVGPVAGVPLVLELPVHDYWSDLGFVESDYWISMLLS